MATVVMNFKSVEVTGATKQEALNKAPFNTIMRDATSAYKKLLEKGAVTPEMLKQFMLDYIASNSRNAPGIGFSITLQSAVASKRERPYTIEDVKNEKGKRKFASVYKWIDDETGAVVASSTGTKKEAKDALKKLYINGSYTGNATMKIFKDVVEGEPVAAKAKYTPSKGTQEGKYIVFGIEA